MPQILEEGGQTDRNAIPLYTREKRYIINARKLETHPDIMREKVRFSLSISPEVKLRSATQVYNCMGMVFASRRTCVDIDSLDLIIADDRYLETRDLSKVKIGDVVVYGVMKPESGETPTHVGVIVDKTPNIAQAGWNVTVMSQWGQDGEYFHPMEAVPPLFGPVIKYLTDRKEA
jgi:hypothetical protein